MTTIGLTDSVPARRARCRHRRASRGQALIIAVLIMFILTGLAGVFIALINQAMIHAARAEERLKLAKVLQAGLEHAKNEILFSPSGADWRPDRGPDINNPGWVHTADGFYKIIVSYGPHGEITDSSPFNANPLDRFLTVKVDARFALENPPRMKDPTDTAAEEYRKGFLNPKRFINRQVVALVPLGLPDYARWFTNLDGNPDPMRLGIDVDLSGMTTVIDDPSGKPDDWLNDSATNWTVASALSYLTVIEGPVRSNGPLALYNVRLDFTNEELAPSNYAGNSSYVKQFYVLRRDMLEVVGALEQFEGTTAISYVLVNAQDQEMGATSLQTYQYIFDPVAAQASATMLQFLQNPRNNALMRGLKPPLLDQAHPSTGLRRYMELTLGSGEWAANSAYNTGALGYGEGMYINNPEDIQCGGDLDVLRQEWLNTTADNWEHGVYNPDPHAVQIILHDWEYASATASITVTQPPYIELRRVGGKPFYDKGNMPVGHSIVTPYPRNGVIYAEGNVIVKGQLPASLAFTDDDGDGVDSPEDHDQQYVPLYRGVGGQAPGGWSPFDGRINSYSKPDGTFIPYVTEDGSIGRYVDEVNRRFDLTIVSGGTIYVEGNLLSPSSRRNNYVENVSNVETLRVMRSGSEYDSKLALMAMDYVCLNPTRLFEVEEPSDTSSAGGERFWRTGLGIPPINLNFTTAGPIDANTRIMLRHAGESALINPLYCAFRLRVNSVPYLWDIITNPPPLDPPATADRFYFCSEELRDQFVASSVINNIFTQWGSEFFDPNWRLQFVDQFDGTRRVFPASLPLQLYGFGAENTLRFEWLDGTTHYLLSAGSDDMGSGFLVTPGDLQIDALIYAQRGSWFIIPGRYYNEREDQDLPWPYPKYQEPLDFRIVINGAIAENRPAPPEAEEAWVSHWRGSNLQYFISPGNNKPHYYDPGSPQSAWNRDDWRWSDRRLGIEYHYDATLARPVCYDVDPDNPGTRYYYPRLPKLPVSPNVFSIGPPSS
ncbi:MAG: hypothetical protein ACYC7E_15890 [Armatimonadota bacterium]